MRPAAPRTARTSTPPPFPPLASLARRTPPPLGALRVPQRPAAAVHLPLPLLLRRRADRRCAKSAISTGTLAVPMRADASASSRCRWLHGPTCTPLGPPRPLSTARCDSPVPQPTTPRYQPPSPQILHICLRQRRSPLLQKKQQAERIESFDGTPPVFAVPQSTPLTHPPPLPRLPAPQPAP